MVVSHLEVLRVPADLVDVGQRAAVVRTLTPGETELLGLELEGQKTNKQTEADKQQDHTTGSVSK